MSKAVATMRMQVVLTMGERNEFRVWRRGGHFGRWL